MTAAMEQYAQSVRVVIAQLQLQPNDTWTPDPSGSTMQAFAVLVAVVAILGFWVWLMRRGTFGRGTHGAVTIETAVPLGDRRSLVIVSVEGRRLLLGLTPANVSLVTQLDASATASEFSGALDAAESRESSEIS